jgi:chorismate mutase
MNQLPAPPSLALAGARRAIDQVDDALLLLVAARRRIVRMLAPMKRGSGEAARDRALAACGRPVDGDHDPSFAALI